MCSLVANFWPLINAVACALDNENPPVVLLVLELLMKPACWVVELENALADCNDACSNNKALLVSAFVIASPEIELDENLADDELELERI